MTVWPCPNRDPHESHVWNPGVTHGDKRCPGVHEERGMSGQDREAIRAWTEHLLLRLGVTLTPGVVQGVMREVAEVVRDAEQRADAAEAEVMNLGADYDRRGERLWRLAARAGWTPSDADNDAVAEMYIRDAIARHAEVDQEDRGMSEQEQDREALTWSRFGRCDTCGADAGLPCTVGQYGTPSPHASTRVARQPHARREVTSA